MMSDESLSGDGNGNFDRGSTEVDWEVGGLRGLGQDIRCVVVVGIGQSRRKPLGGNNLRFCA